MFVGMFTYISSCLYRLCLMHFLFFSVFLSMLSFSPTVGTLDVLDPSPNASKSLFLWPIVLIRTPLRKEIVVKGINMSTTSVNTVPILAWKHENNKLRNHLNSVSGNKVIVFAIFFYNILGHGSTE